MDRCVTRGEEEDGDGGCEEIVEADLLAAVDVSGLVQVCECSDCIFCQFHDSRCIGMMFLDTRSRMKNGTVNQNAHLVAAEVQ